MIGKVEDATATGCGSVGAGEGFVAVLLARCFFRDIFRGRDSKWRSRFPPIFRISGAGDSCRLKSRVGSRRGVGRPGRRR